MSSLFSTALRILIALTVLGSIFSAHADVKPYTNVEKAKLLLDTYYGDPGILRQVAKLLSPEVIAGSANSDGYVQAARLAMNGTYITGEEYQAGGLDLANKFLDRGISLNPKNQETYLLRSEIFGAQKDYSQQKVALEKAKLVGPQNSWLLFNYGDYCENTGDPLDYYYYSQVRTLGPGDSPRQRRMFVMALTALARFKPAPGEPFELKQLAELASNERYPTDAWVFGNFAGEFLFHGMFDDAIIYSEKAIKIRTYGGARLALAASLYAKAAKLTQENNINEAQKFILRARLLRFGRDDILARLERTGGEAILPLLPTIEGTLWGARCDE